MFGFLYVPVKNMYEDLNDGSKQTNILKEKIGLSLWLHHQ